jgi:hypothetical protein
VAKAVNKGGAPTKGDDSRTVDRAQNYSVSEWERIEWAAKELGLPPASFVRMAALKESRGVLG